MTQEQKENTDPAAGQDICQWASSLIVWIHSYLITSSMLDIHQIDCKMQRAGLNAIWAIHLNGYTPCRKDLAGSTDQAGKHGFGALSLCSSSEGAHVAMPNSVCWNCFKLAGGFPSALELEAKAAQPLDSLPQNSPVTSSDQVGCKWAIYL